MKNNETKLNRIWPPFGFIDDGMGDDTFMDADGDLWAYGDKQEEVGYMWNY